MEDVRANKYFQCTKPRTKYYPVMEIGYRTWRAPVTSLGEQFSMFVQTVILALFCSANESNKYHDTPYMTGQMAKGISMTAIHQARCALLWDRQSKRQLQGHPSVCILSYTRHFTAGGGLFPRSAMLVRLLLTNNNRGTLV